MSDGIMNSMLKTLLHRRNLVVGCLLIFVLSYAWIWMQNFDIRMASLHTDDGPMFYSYAFKNPELFKGDLSVWIPVSIIVPLRVLTSAMIWVPALMWRYLAITPYITTWLITLLQIISIGFSIYVFVWGVTNNRTVAIMAVFFAYAATLWGWDPANYGAGRMVAIRPYSAYLAIPPALVAFVMLIRKRYLWVLICMGIAGLIHQNVTIFAIAIVGLYWLWQTLKDPSVPRWPFLFGLVFVTGVTVLPALLFQLWVPYEQLPHDEVMAGIRVNQHVWPWHYQGRWPRTPEMTLKWLVLMASSMRFRKCFSRETLMLALASLVIAVIFSIIHIGAAIFEIPFLLYFTGLRSWMWSMFIFLPFIILYWYRHLVSGKWVGMALSLSCLFIPLIDVEYALFWFLIAGLAFLDISEGCFIFWQFAIPLRARKIMWLAALACLVTWWVTFLFLPVLKGCLPAFVASFLSHCTWNVLGSPPSLYVRMALLMVVGTASVVIFRISEIFRQKNHAYFPKPHGIKIVFGLLIALYAVLFLGPEWWKAGQERRSSLASLLDVQLWARNNTSPAAMFVVQAPGWRTMSLRRQLSPTTRESYIYVACHEAKEQRDRVLNFFRITKEEGRRLRGNQIYNIELARFYAFNEDGYRRFNSEFGATHLVLSRDKMARMLDLLLIYENKHYLVYSLEPNP